MPPWQVAGPVRVHLDTDIGGDIDDLCALAFLIAHPGVEIIGVTTVAEESGRRAGYARYALGIGGAGRVPVAAGADVSLGRLRLRPGYPPDERYWPAPIPPAPGPLESALELLKRAADEGAVIVAVGPFTNLALLEERNPGILESLGPNRLVLMGGHIRPVPQGFPRWDSAERDYNVQLDIAAARCVLERAATTLVPIEVTVQTALRRAHLAPLRRAGALGALLAQQAEECARDWGNEERYGRTCNGLPDDTINFLHDPLACAAALGWPGFRRDELSILLEERDGLLHQRIDATGMGHTIVTEVDGEAFGEFWLETVTGPRV